MRVHQAEFDGWECEWDPEFGSHTWRRGKECHVLWSNAAWAPGMEAVGYDDEAKYPPRFHIRRTGLSIDEGLTDGPRAPVVSVYPFSGIGNVYDAGEQGGQDIALHPTAKNGGWRADRIAERNPIAAFHAHTGEILTRRELGKDEYRLDRTHVGVWHPTMQHACFEPYPGHEISSWTAIDGAHLCRAFMDDLWLWRDRRDPVARWRLMMLAQDVVNAFALDTSVAGDLNLGKVLINLRRDPETFRGGIGAIRNWAWPIYAVAAARDAYGKPHREWDIWLRSAVEMVALVQLPCGAFSSLGYEDGLDQGEPFWSGGVRADEKYTVSWQAPFLIRAAYEAAVHVGMKRRLIPVVQRYCALLENEALIVPGEYGGPPGLPRYLVVGDTPKVGFETSRSEGEPDVFAVRYRLTGDAIPERFVRDGQPEFMADVWEITK